MPFYDCPVDFSDIAQMTVFRSEGVQLVLEQFVKEFDAKPTRAKDGVILGFETEEDLSDEKLKELSERMQDGWRKYVATK